MFFGDPAKLQEMLVLVWEDIERMTQQFLRTEGKKLQGLAEQIWDE